MDFVHDQLGDGRPFRVLTVVDQWSRATPVLDLGFSLSRHDVVRALDAVIAARGRPTSITRDHALP